VNVDSDRRKAGRKAKAKDTLRSQLRETVRVTILDAAEARLSAQGLHATSLAEIAKSAGVAVGTLYNYFQDRDALVRALLESRRGTLGPQCEAAISAGTELPFEPRLRMFTRELFEAFERHRGYLKIMFQAEHLKSTTTKVDFFAVVGQIAEVGVAEGVIAATSSQTFVTVFTGAIRSVLLRCLQNNRAFAEDADPICTLILDGARRR